MSRMGIQVLHDQGLGRYYSSALFRRLGQELDPLVHKYPDPIRMWGGQPRTPSPRPPREWWIRVTVATPPGYSPGAAFAPVVRRVPGSFAILGSIDLKASSARTLELLYQSVEQSSRRQRSTHTGPSAAARINRAWGSAVTSGRSKHRTRRRTAYAAASLPRGCARGVAG